VRGRGLAALDALPGREAAVVNQQFVELHFQGRDPVGQRIQLGAPAPGNAPAPGGAPPPGVAPTPWLTIVGVAPTLPRLAFSRLTPYGADRPDPTVYVHWSVDPTFRAATIMTRVTTALPTAVEGLRREAAALDADLPLFAVEPYEQAVARTRLGDRMLGTWFGVVAFIALVVASVGLAAVTSHGVAQRRQEIGIRIALGAESHQVTWLFLRRTLRNLAMGLTIGVAGALGIGQLLAGLMPGSSPPDSVTIGLVTGLLFVVTLLAGLIPARRAAAVDPAVALRAD